MRDHLMICDGRLYDTRAPNWTTGAPVRAIYSRGVAQITTLGEVKAALRGGAYTDLGGYPLYFVTRDGGALSFDAVRERWREVVAEFMDDTSTGWRICALEVNYEDGALTCDHTGKRIPSAYAEDSSDAEEA